MKLTYFVACKKFFIKILLLLCPAFNNRLRLNPKNQFTVVATLVFILQVINVKSQQFENIEAYYQNDTLIITYDLIGKVIVDSLEIKVSSYITRKKYFFHFQGDSNYGIEPGNKKRVWVYFPRDSFPTEGESLKIQLKGWVKSSTGLRRGNRMSFTVKPPVNPRFTLTSSIGVLSPSSEFSEIGYSLSSTFYYQPASFFQVGLGGINFSFVDSIKSFSTTGGYISTKYKFDYATLPVYLLMNYGYCYENDGPFLTLGFGLEKYIWGPTGFDINLNLNKFYGTHDLFVVGLQAAFYLKFSSRRRFKKDRIYRFPNFLTYVELGTNNFNRVMPNLDVDIAKNISPFYTQGVGIAVESIHYNLDYEIVNIYHSTYYNRNIEYISDVINLDLKLLLIPIYINGRLYLTLGKFRPYLIWKYGFSIYSNVDKGMLKNGFTAGLGFGFQTPYNKKTGITFSCGLKYFNNKYSNQGFEHNYFGTFFTKVGIVF